jgi:hypothetical protein
MEIPSVLHFCMYTHFEFGCLVPRQPAYCLQNIPTSLTSACTAWRLLCSSIVGRLSRGVRWVTLPTFTVYLRLYQGGWWDDLGLAVS